MTSQISLSANVPVSLSGCRFDQAAADLFPDFSRSRLQQWIKEGQLTINGASAKANAKVAGGERLCIEAALEEEGAWIAEDIPLNIIFEDDAIIVIDKPVDLVVHPAAGNWSGTLLNALVFRYPQLKLLPRAGIVHRLDKDTTGLMVVAKTLEAQTKLVEQMQARHVKREYRAIVHGEPVKEGSIDAPLGRHPAQRTKMAVVRSGGKEAITHYWPIEYCDGFTLVKLRLETGRTHQIRVHMAHIGFPLIGDTIYGHDIPKLRQQRSARLMTIARFPRQALHACKLGLIHPITGKSMEWESPYPDDFATLLTHLRDTLE